ncbi:MAG: aldo/keto reductase [Nitrospinae bacterium]|nr:aldo/keto reductase [Nitrospinota bacterium]
MSVSRLAFGAWQIGGPPFWKSTDDDTAIKTIEAALECGINFFDTAPVYGLGHSEELIGMALKKHRDKVFIATKCGLLWDAQEKIHRSLKQDSIREEVADSLRRLGLDYIDLYQIHFPSPDDPIEKAIETLAELKAEGKIRAIGVSNFDVPTLKKAVGVARVDTLQPKYNLLERDAEKELLPFCLENNIAVTAYSPLASGLLTGKYTSAHKFEDWRGKSGMGVFKKEELAKAYEKLESLKTAVGGTGRSLAEFSLNWVLANKAVTCAIVGAREARQIAELAKFSERPLSSDELKLA